MTAYVSFPHTESRFEWALAYAAQGIPVFPCHGKNPLTRHGFYDASCDPLVIQRWWHQWREANIATPTGHWCWVMDVDPRHGGDITLRAYEQQLGRLPDTARSLTGGGGEHYVFALPPTGQVRHHCKIGEGLDIQAIGGYIMLPPSIHPDTGKMYIWDVGADLEDPGLCQAPDWLLALVTRDPVEQSTLLQPEIGQGSTILQGTREDTLVRIGAAMRHAGADYVEILAALTQANTRCEPPLLDRDILRMSRSVTRYAIDPILEVSHSNGHLNGHGQSSPLVEEKKVHTVPELLDLADLLERTYPLPQWIIKGLIPEGLTFFAGSPKSSKTYLAYSLALSLALESLNNGFWLDHYAISLSGPVIYITLEDDEADSKQRVLELYPGLRNVPKGRFIFHHGIDLPELGNGLVEYIEKHFVLPYKPALIILDPISYLYAPQKKNGDQFTEVRQMLLPLRTLARHYHFGLIGVDHRRKKAADDVDIFETLYGSNAKIALADSLLVIVRDQKEITIHAKVRKGADQTLTLLFTFEEDGTAHWSWKGTSEGLLNPGQYGDLRQKVLTVLMNTRRSMSIGDMLFELDIPDSRAARNSLGHALNRLCKSGDAQKTTRGQFMFHGEAETL